MKTNAMVAVALVALAWSVWSAAALAQKDAASGGDRQKAIKAMLDAGIKLVFDGEYLTCDSKTDMDAVLKVIHYFPNIRTLILEGVGTDEHLKGFEVLKNLNNLDLLAPNGFHVSSD